MGSFEKGWNGFFRVLRLYLAHFPGQVGATASGVADTALPESDAWTALVAALGLPSEAAVGQRWTTGTTAPPMVAILEHVAPDAREVIARLEVPCVGIAFFGVASWEGTVHPSFSFYVFGDGAAAGAKAQGAAWNRWLAVPSSTP